MTTPVNPFPEVLTSDDLDGAPTREYIECVGCINMTRVNDGMDLVEWAKEHRRVKPWHSRFRIIHIQNFSVPGDDEPATHAAEAYPSL